MNISLPTYNFTTTPLAMPNYVCDPYFAIDCAPDPHVLPEEPREPGSTYTCDYCEVTFSSWKKYWDHCKPCCLHHVGRYTHKGNEYSS